MALRNTDMFGGRVNVPQSESPLLAIRQREDVQRVAA